MVVSKVKRANHMKQKKGLPGGKAPATDPSKLKHKIYKHTSKTAPSPKVRTIDGTDEGRLI